MSKLRKEIQEIKIKCYFFNKKLYGYWFIVYFFIYFIGESANKLSAIKYTDDVDIATQTIVAIICPITPYRVENKIYDARKDIKEEMRIGTSTL